MGKLGHDVLLGRAEVQFLEGEFENALRSYGLILANFPTLDEARVGVVLSDLAMESAEEAQALFEYYHVIKENKENAVGIIEEFLKNMDNTSQKLHELLTSPWQEQIEYSDGIRYSDFIASVKSRGNFKKTFEDIMFSTKVVISNKDEFIDFVTRLSKEGFDEMALGYLDASIGLFGNDQDILGLYHVLRKSQK
jgi:tetratricopeptide (TPR) repeat protein